MATEATRHILPAGEWVLREASVPSFPARHVATRDMHILGAVPVVMKVQGLAVPRDGGRLQAAAGEIVVWRLLWAEPLEVQAQEVPGDAEAAAEVLEAEG